MRIFSKLRSNSVHVQRAFRKFLKVLKESQSILGERTNNSTSKIIIDQSSINQSSINDKLEFVNDSGVMSKMKETFSKSDTQRRFNDESSLANEIRHTYNGPILTDNEFKDYSLTPKMSKLSLSEVESPALNVTLTPNRGLTLPDGYLTTHLSPNKKKRTLQ